VAWTQAARPQPGAPANPSADAIPSAPLARRYAQHLLDYAAQRGIDPAGLFGDEPVFARQRAQGRWNNHHLALISRHLKERTGDDFWGMLDGRAPRHAIRFACEVCTLSETLEAGLLRAFRSVALSCQGLRVGLERDGDGASLWMQVEAGDERNVQLICEWSLWQWRHMAQWFIGAEIPLTEAAFPGEPIGAPEDYETPFGLRRRFATGQARLRFPAAVLALPIVRTPHDLDLFYQRSVIPLSYSPEAPSLTSSLVKAALRARLRHSGDVPTLEGLAAEYGVCGQTLRRRLISEGVSYRSLKAQVRQEIAGQHLRGDGQATLSEVAARAGYAEPNSLTRAIRGWTGLSAAEFRRRLGAAAD
jgi:AraC-like DNA-binding protein